MNPEPHLILRLIRRWNEDWKRKRFAPVFDRVTLRSASPVCLYLLLLFFICDHIWESKFAYGELLRRAAHGPGNLLDRRHVSGCAFEYEVPGWNDLLNAVSKRVPDSEKILFVPLGPDSPAAAQEQNSASCVLTYELFPRPVIYVTAHNRGSIDGNSLLSTARSRQARYLIMYRGSAHNASSFAGCRFGEDLFLVDIKNELSCEHDD
jgi:hypothetical protein